MDVWIIQEEDRHDHNTYIHSVWSSQEAAHRVLGQLQENKGMFQEFYIDRWEVHDFKK